jgi:chromate transporter
MGLSGFGGVTPWARRMLVEERQWLTDREFTETFGLCQFLPGSNVCNAAVVIGSRFYGAAGAWLALVGLMLVPVSSALALGLLYHLFGHIQAVQHATLAISTAAAGLIISTALKMARKQPQNIRLYALLVVTFLSVGMVRWPLLGVLFLMGPAGIGWEWRASK